MEIIKNVWGRYEIRNKVTDGSYRYLSTMKKFPYYWWVESRHYSKQFWSLTSAYKMYKRLSDVDKVIFPVSLTNKAVYP